MSIRFATVAVATGVAAAVALLPWGYLTHEALISGQTAPTWAIVVGHLLAFLGFVTAGALTTRGRVVRPWLTGPMAGFVAASLAAWLVWLPVTHASALEPLWAVVRAGQAPGDEASSVIGPATNALLVQGILGFWGFATVGALGGLIGTAVSRGSRREHRGAVRVPFLWPLRLWAWSGLLVVAGFVVLHQGEFDIIWTAARGHGAIDPGPLFMINGALLGLITAAPFGASFYRLVRSSRVPLRRLAVRGYGVLGSLVLLLWWAVLPLMAPSLVGPTPEFAAYALAPLVGAAIGAAVVRRDPEPPVARAADVWREMMPLAILTGPMVAGPGLGGVAWAALVGPLVWRPYLADPPETWPLVAGTLSEVVLFPAAAWALLVLVPMIEALVVFLPVLIGLRQGAVRDFVRQTDEIREAHTAPRLQPVSTSPRKVDADAETELRQPPVTG